MPRRLVVAVLLLGPAAAGATEPTLVALRGRDPEGLRALLVRQQDPASPDHGRWLTLAEFGRRFGASGPTLRRASRWLRGRGCRVKRWASRQLVECRGPAVDAPPADLAAVVDDVLPPGGPPARVPAVPTAPRPHWTVQGNFFFSPQEFARVYDLDDLRTRLDGSGERIGILGFSAIDPADIAMFRSSFGLPPLALVQGPGGRLPGTAFEIEALLDVSWSGAIAPAARSLLVVVPPFATALVRGLAVLVHTPDVSVISLSVDFGRDRGTGRLIRQAYRLFRQAAAQGQTVFVASGDTGPYVTRNGRLRTGTSPLASSPHVTAVGGTTPSPVLDTAGFAEGYGSEVVWNAGLAASGGGVAPVVRPAYQHGRRRRTIPDVAFPADRVFPWVQNGNRLCCVGGTSAGAPAWAGVVALLNQARGRRAGPLNPELYRLGRAQAAGGPAVFHDVTVGSNGRWDAGPGHDLATGWGSIDGDAFFAAMGVP